MINNQESNLSLGEKQIICIARASLKKDIKVLCFDEATSCLDEEMERNICKTIKNAFPKCTILMISHRPMSCLNCDFVMVIGDGKLIEYDKADNLICDTNSEFYKMWLLQQNNRN